MLPTPQLFEILGVNDSVFIYKFTKTILFSMSKSLRRSSNSMIAGVCAGVANYFDIDPTVVRILWVFFTLCGGAGIILYIIMLILMPK